MNSIRQPRKRPRVESVSFRGLWWVLVREAALRIIYRSSMESPTERAARLAVNLGSTFAIRSTAATCLDAHPERKTWVPRNELHPFAVQHDFDFWSTDRQVSPIVQAEIDRATAELALPYRDSARATQRPTA